MAPLTWKNVDAPNFQSVTDSYRLMGQLLNSGFDSARRGLGDFQEHTQNAQSSQMMAEVLKRQDPNQLRADLANGTIMNGFNPNYITPDAMKFAGNQAQSLLNERSTEASTMGQLINNNYNQQAMPHKIQGLIQGNVGQDIQNRSNSFNLDVRQQQHAALPAYNELASQVIALTNQGNIEEATALAGSAQATQALTAAGKSPEDLLMSVDRRMAADHQNSLILRAESDQIEIDKITVQSQEIEKEIVGGGYTDMDQVLTALNRMERRNNYDPRATQIARNNLQARGEDLFTSGRFMDDTTPGTAQAPIQNTERQRNVGGSNQIVMANQNKIRDKDLSPELRSSAAPILEQFPGVEMVVTSGGQDNIASGSTRRVGGERHDDGNAADVQFKYNGRILSGENPQDRPILAAILGGFQANGMTGFGYHKDYMGDKTFHIGFGTPAVWAGAGKDKRRPVDEWFANALSGRGQAQRQAGPTTEAAALLAGASQGTRSAQSMAGGANSAQAMLSQASGTTQQQTQGAFEPFSVNNLDGFGLVEALPRILEQGRQASADNVVDEVNSHRDFVISQIRNNDYKNLPPRRVIDRLQENLGSMEAGTEWFAWTNNRDNIQQLVHETAQKYKIEPATAAVLIENSLSQAGTSAPILRWIMGNRREVFDRNLIDEVAKEIINDKGELKTEASTRASERVRLREQKEQLDNQIGLWESRLTALQQRVIAAQNVEDGNPAPAERELRAAYRLYQADVRKYQDIARSYQETR